MTAQSILKMIETVSPEDTATLDEIDARVWHWITGSHPETIAIVNLDLLLSNLSGFNPRPRYTRSRDALKAIRPEGWTYRAAYHYPKPDGEYGFVMNNNPSERLQAYQVVGKSFATEELAELDAIIQAIEYEKNQTLDI